MRGSILGLCIPGVLLLGPAMFLAVSPAADRLATVTIDYPANESIFPPDFAAPTFLFRDAADSTVLWRIKVAFADGSRSLRVESRAPHMQVGEIDTRYITPTRPVECGAVPLDRAGSPDPAQGRPGGRQRTRASAPPSIGSGTLLELGVELW